jgi:hypothetical protein
LLLKDSNVIPDLNPIDFFLWGNLKQSVFITKPANTEELIHRITEETRQIPPEMIQKVIEGFYHRLGHCQGNLGNILNTYCNCEY